MGKWHLCFMVFNITISHNLQQQRLCLFVGCTRDDHYPVCRWTSDMIASLQPDKHIQKLLSNGNRIRIRISETLLSILRGFRLLEKVTMVMVYCFIWLSPQAEAPWKPSHAVNQPLVKIRAKENTMAQQLISVNKDDICRITTPMQPREILSCSSTATSTLTALWQCEVIF